VKIRFLRDYRGALTFEQYHQVGEEADYPDEVAAALIGRGVAMLPPAPPALELTPLTDEELAPVEPPPTPPKARKR